MQALNLRELIRKYGRNIGLNLKVVRVYTFQLLRVSCSQQSQAGGDTVCPAAPQLAPNPTWHQQSPIVYPAIQAMLRSKFTMESAACAAVTSLQLELGMSKKLPQFAVGVDHA